MSEEQHEVVPPTPEWIEKHASSGYAPKGSSKVRYADRDPLRIDKLLRKSLIEPHQHTAAQQFYTLWMAAMCRGMRSPIGNLGSPSCQGPESAILSRLTAEEKYRWLQFKLTVRDHHLLHLVVCEEVAALTAGKQLGIQRDLVMETLRAALETLSELQELLRSQVEEMVEQRNREMAGVVKAKYRGVGVAWAVPEGESCE